MTSVKEYSGPEFLQENLALVYALPFAYAIRALHTIYIGFSINFLIFSDTMIFLLQKIIIMIQLKNITTIEYGVRQ